MKHWMLAVALICFGSITAFAEDIGGLQRLLGDKLAEAVPVGIVNINAKPAAAPFLPIWTFQDMNQTGYVELGIGGKFQSGVRPHAFGAFDFNFVALSARVWNFEWAQTHVKRSKFPPIWLGPSFEAPIDLQLAKKWRWDENVGLMFSVRFGSK